MNNMMTRSRALVLAAAGFSLLSMAAFAQQTTTDSQQNAGGAVATGSASANPVANPQVPGDNSTISGDKAATAEQQTGTK
jgi:hypothetical protein